MLYIFIYIYYDIINDNGPRCAYVFWFKRVISVLVLDYGDDYLYCIITKLIAK